MSHAAVLTRSSWYSEGLRWIGALFTGAADALERRNAPVLHTHESWRRKRAMEEYLEDVRFRMHSGF